MGTERLSSSQDDDEVRKGPWTMEEDLILINYIANHGEGVWNSLAKAAGLKRTGKSCRLRWLNYLRPGVRRGNITPEEQVLIMDLHSKWGNRWSKIAQHLPGRTDNEIKNYWRTRVQKQARHLNMDTDSDAFQQIIRYYWMPRLIQKINQSSPLPPQPPPPPPSELPGTSQAEMVSQSSYGFEAPATATPLQIGGDLMGSSCNSSSSSSSGFQNYENYGSFVNDYWDEEHGKGEMMNWATTAVTGDSGYPVAHCHMAETNWTHTDFTGYVPSMDELWQF